MTCHKFSGAGLHSLVMRKAMGVLDVGELQITNIECEPSYRPLVVPPLKYDPRSMADLAVVNAILPGKTEPQTLLIRENVIIRLGKHADVADGIDDGTRVIDACMGTVLPGFTDSHLHLTVAMEKSRGCDVEDVTSADEFVRRVQEFAMGKTREPVLHVYGLHYFEPPIIPADTARLFLDNVVADKPLVVFAHDLHTSWANTAALQEAGLLHAIPPYPELIELLGLEEKVVVGPDGQPGGELREPEVYSLLTGPLQEKYPVPLEERLESLRNACLSLAEHGFTCVHSMGLAQPAEDVSFFLLLLELEQQDRLPIRVNTSFSSVADKDMLTDVYQAFLIREAFQRALDKGITASELHEYLLQRLEQAVAPREVGRATEIGEASQRITEAVTRLADMVSASHLLQHKERDNPHARQGMPRHLRRGCKVRCDTVKIFFDGIVEKKTAYRLDEEPTAGIPEFSRQEVDDLVAFADKLGMQVAAHCIGSASVRSMLDAVERARYLNAETNARRGHVIRHRVEHIEMCGPEDISRFGALEVVASMQPLHEREPVTLWHKLVPDDQWDTAFAWKDIVENGAVLVFGSDWPIVPCDARKAIHHAVTRKPWKRTHSVATEARSQAVSLERALAAYTGNAAMTDYSEKVKGKLEPGMLADIVILAGDVGRLSEECDVREEVCFPAVRTTICDGRVVCSAEIEENLGE